MVSEGLAPGLSVIGRLVVGFPRPLTSLAPGRSKRKGGRPPAPALPRFSSPSLLQKGNSAS